MIQNHCFYALRFRRHRLMIDDPTSAIEKWLFRDNKTGCSKTMLLANQIAT